MAEQQQLAAESADITASVADSGEQQSPEEPVSSESEQLNDRQAQEDHIVTIVFTAGNHLGYAAPGQSPRKREEWQQRLRLAFQQATDFAIGQRVDLFIQAGDLFDSTTPDERDRSFVAARLAQLRQANVRVFALSGTHDTPVDAHGATGKDMPAPQQGYASLGALTYFTPDTLELEPVIIDIHGILVGICGLTLLADHSDDALVRLHVPSDIERAALPILLLHASIEGLDGSSSTDRRPQISRESIVRQSTFRTILAGHHHAHRQFRLGQCDVIVAGATQYDGYEAAGEAPGFVFLGLDRQGIRWCKHIPVSALPVRNLVVDAGELWPSNPDDLEKTPTDAIIARLQPLCDGETIVQVRLEGTLTRQHYHQLDLHRLRRFGEEHAFALTIDDSGLELLPEPVDSATSQSAHAPLSQHEKRAYSTSGERFSPREELIALADEWIAASPDESEKNALRATREDLLAALDEMRHSGANV